MSYDILYHLFLDPCAHGIACLLVAYLVVPSQFVKIVYQETGESYGSILSRYLRAGNLSIFFSGAHIFALRQFISAVAFGMAQWLFYCLIAIYPISNVIYLILWQCCLNGIVETIMTVYSEIKEIAANKGHLMQRKESIMDVFVPLLIRNILAGSPAILAYETTKHMDGIAVNVTISGIFSIVAAILAMPFDLTATQSCGSMVPMHWVRRLQQNVSIGRGFFSIFSGLTMRIIQLCAFSIIHGLVILFLKKWGI